MVKDYQQLLTSWLGGLWLMELGVGTKLLTKQQSERSIPLAHFSSHMVSGFEKPHTNFVDHKLPVLFV